MPTKQLNLEPEIAAHVLTRWHPKVSSYPFILATKEVDLFGRGEPTHAKIEFDYGKAVATVFIPAKNYLAHQQTYYLEDLENDQCPV